MPLLKADLHIHTSEDPEDTIRYSATDLIDRAREYGYSVLAITNHNSCLYNRYLRDYARERGIVLIPGMEATIQGRHVLLLNFDFSRINPARLEELYGLKDQDNLIIAPHPYFPSTVALRALFRKNIRLFDAVELSHHYCPRLDFNKKALRLARQHGLPVVGTSDAHQRCQFNTTYSLIEAYPDTETIIDAIKKGKVKVVTKPLPLSLLIRINMVMFIRNHIMKR